MFKLQKPESVKWPVEVSIPRDGGHTTKATFNVQFQIIDQDEFSAIYDQKGTDRDLINRVCIGWDQTVCDENGDPMPFSQEALDKMTNLAYVRTAMVTAYLNCANGRKN